MPADGGDDRLTTARLVFWPAVLLAFLLNHACCLHAHCCSDQPVMDRVQAAYEIMQWRNNDQSITRRDGFEYMAALRVIFAAGHDPAFWDAHEPTPTDGHFVDVRRFTTIVTEGFVLFEALPVLSKPLA